MSWKNEKVLKDCKGAHSITIGIDRDGDLGIIDNDEVYMARIVCKI